MAIALPSMRRRGQAGLGTLPPAACRSPGWTWQRGSEGSGRTDRRKEQRRRQQPGARSRADDRRGDVSGLALPLRRSAAGRRGCRTRLPSRWDGEHAEGDGCQHIEKTDARVTSCDALAFFRPGLPGSASWTLPIPSRRGDVSRRHPVATGRAGNVIRIWLPFTACLEGQKRSICLHSVMRPSATSFQPQALGIGVRSAL